MDPLLDPVQHGVFMPKGDLVCVVDDDESVRESLRGLFASTGLEAITFSSAEQFLAASELARVGCLVLDVQMPGMTGPELQRELLAREADIVVVFISAMNDEGVRQRTMSDGALDYLVKPFDDELLLDLVAGAMAGAFPKAPPPP